MLDLGASERNRIKDGQVWRFITPCLLHGGILHIFFNMVFQTMFGYTLEKNWGTPRMIGIYFATSKCHFLQKKFNNMDFCGTHETKFDFNYLKRLKFVVFCQIVSCWSNINECMRT